MMRSWEDYEELDFQCYLGEVKVNFKMVKIVFRKDQILFKRLLVCKIFEYLCEMCIKLSFNNIC